MKIKQTKSRGKRFYPFLLALLLVFCALPAQAAEGEPLQLIGSTPAVESTVDVAFQVQLEFNQDVVAGSLQEANHNCFMLHDAAGGEVAIVLELAADEATGGSTVTVSSLVRIAPGDYTLVVDGALQSAAGQSLGDDLRLPYTVAEMSPLPAQVAETQDDPEAPAQPLDPETAQYVENMRVLTIALIVIVSIALVIYLFVIWRRNHR